MPTAHGTDPPRDYPLELMPPGPDSKADATNVGWPEDFLDDFSAHNETFLERLVAQIFSNVARDVPEPQDLERLPPLEPVELDIPVQLPEPPRIEDPNG